MKTSTFTKSLAVLAIASLSAFGWRAGAQDTPASPAVSVSNANPAPQLSYGVSQILQLSQAKMSDDTIIAFVKNSSNSYGLDASQIIYLRQQGVSEAVITAMLNQPRPGVAVASTPPPAAPASTTAMDTTTSAGPSATVDTTTTAVPTATVAPTVTYVQTVPTYYYPPSYYYGYPYPYYYGYGVYPAISIGVGYGFHGGWGGGYHYGGGFHGGGGFHR